MNEPDIPVPLEPVEPDKPTTPTESVEDTPSVEVSATEELMAEEPSLDTSTGEADSEEPQIPLEESIEGGDPLPSTELSGSDIPFTEVDGEATGISPEESLGSDNPSAEVDREATELVPAESVESDISSAEADGEATEIPPADASEIDTASVEVDGEATEIVAEEASESDTPSTEVDEEATEIVAEAATEAEETLSIETEPEPSTEADVEAGDAPISVAIPDLMDSDSGFADQPLADVPSGASPTDESPSENEPFEPLPESANAVSVAVGESAESIVAEAVPEPIKEPAPPPAPPRPPVPPVFFVWHNHMNEEREDFEVVPSERLREAYHLLEVTGALHWREVKTHTPDLNLGRPESLTSYHSKAYCQSIVAVSEGRANLWSAERRHLPTLTRSVPTAGLNVAAARSAVKVAMSHPKARVFTLAGQQPHACRDHLEEGHLFNDVIMALTDAQTAGMKTAFINLDAEHPRQIQERFYNDPLLTISLHEHPSFLSPYSGTARETGKGAGAGYHVNIPMPPGVSDAGYQMVMEQMVLPLLNRFQPQLLVVLGGSTAHVNDPASHLRLTSKGYQTLLTTLMDAVPRFVLFGGDATHYATAARLWAIALATLAERTNSLPPQIPAAHARLWSGGTFHDVEPLWRSAPYQEYTYALLANELEQLHPLLRKQWDLPDLTLPEQLSDQRERIQVRPSGDITTYTSKEPTRGMSFAGLSDSLGDDDDDAETRRKPRPSTRNSPRWQDEVVGEESPPERNKSRGRREETPPANPLAQERRGGNDNRPPREGRPPRDTERGNNKEQPERRIHGAGRGAPESRRGFTRSEESQEPKAGDSASSTFSRNQGQRRQGNEPRRPQDAGRSSNESDETREAKPFGDNRPPRGERPDRSKPSRPPRSMGVPRNSPPTEQSSEEHSPTPSRSTPRHEEGDERTRSTQPFRRRERGGRNNDKPATPPPSDGTPPTESPDSRPARRHRPRSRR